MWPDSYCTHLYSVSATLPSRAMTNLLLVRSVRKGEIMEKSTEKYHGTLMNTCGRVGHAPAVSFKLAQE